MPKLYDFLCNMVSMTSDVVVVKWPNELLCKHRSKCNVKDDLPEKFYDCRVFSVGVSEDYPNQLVVYTI